jgi:uncharacterized RDD family membrane protein YckC
MTEGVPRRGEPAPEPLGLELIEEVRSPEQVALHLPIAGPGSRVLAYAIDYAVILLIEIGLFALLFAATPLLGTVLDWTQPIFNAGDSVRDRAAAMQDATMLLFALFIVAQLVVELGYFFAWEMLSGGRSLGKRVVGLRVVGDDGFALGPQASLVRNLLRLVDVLPGSYLVGLVAMVVSNRGKRLGDLAAGTLVVRLDRPLTALPITDAGAAAPFRFSRPQLAALGSTERTLLRQTLRRLETLPPEQAGDVLAHTVNALGKRLGLDPIPPAGRAAFLHALLRAIESA